MKREHDHHGDHRRGSQGAPWNDDQDRQLGVRGDRNRHEQAGPFGGDDQDRYAGPRQQERGGGRGDDDYTRQLSDRYGHGEGGFDRGAYAQGGYGGAGPRQGGYGYGMSGADPQSRESREGYYRSHPRQERYDDSAFGGRGYGEGRGISGSGSMSSLYQGGEDQPRRSGGNYQTGNEPWRSGEGTGQQQGRRGGFRGKGPKGYTRSDERILEALCERLSDDDDIDASEISVEVRDGVATLTGTVEHRWMKHRAEDLAESCGGVKDVENRIRVVRGGGDGRQSGGGDMSMGSTQQSSMSGTGLGSSQRGS